MRAGWWLCNVEHMHVLLGRLQRRVGCLCATQQLQHWQQEGSAAGTAGGQSVQLNVVLSLALALCMRLRAVCCEALAGAWAASLGPWHAPRGASGSGHAPPETHLVGCQTLLSVQGRAAKQAGQGACGRQTKGASRQAESSLQLPEPQTKSLQDLEQPCSLLGRSQLHCLAIRTGPSKGSDMLLRVPSKPDPSTAQLSSAQHCPALHCRPQPLNSSAPRPGPAPGPAAPGAHP